MRSLFISILFILISSFNLPTFSQQFYFKKFQVEDGISYNSVLCTLQDSDGFMWFGTEDGLNRFDGSKFIIYKKNPEDDTSIGNNIIHSLFEDSDKKIWIGTSNGVYIYDKELGTFNRFGVKTEYDVLISSTISRIIQSENGLIWIATLGQGIFTYNKETNALSQNSTHTSFIWDITEDKRHRIYSSSMQEGLICFDQIGNHIETYNFPAKDGDLRINCIYAKDDRVWFGSGTNNISYLNTTNKTIKQYTDELTKMGVVRSITSFSDQELIIGSDNGLYLFNIIDEKFSRIDNPLDTRSLSDQAINDISKDIEGGYWIATNLGGVNYLSQQTRVFEYYHPSYDSGLGTGRVINHFTEEENGNIWIGTQDGLKLLKNKSITSIPLPRQNKEPDIRTLLLDDNNLWIGTMGYGLLVWDKQANKLKEYTYSRTTSRSIRSNDISSIYKCVNGDVYVGTSWGLCKYAPKTDDFESIINISSLSAVSDLMEDDKNMLWVATLNNGVFRYSTNSNWVMHYSYKNGDPNSIPSNSVISILKDNEGKVWFGTNGSGLCYFNEETNSFVSHQETIVLFQDKVIYSMEQDNLSRLWVSTNAGLICVDIKGRNKPKLYTRENGIQSNQFNYNASLKDRSEKLYFGGINGFNSFFPDELKNNTYAPPTHITDIRFHNDDGHSYSQRSPHSKNDIKLSYNQNSFSIDYATLSYEESNKNMYSYKLEGFDDRWMQNGNITSTSYTNLPPGEYTFRVIGSNNDGLNDGKGASLKMTITPPWWRSNIALFSYFIVISLFLALLVRFLKQRTIKQMRKEVADFEKEKEKELYQSKINFFINLVHEIRTPLSLIKLPLDHLNEQKKSLTDTKSSRYLDIINKNVNYLLSIVNQLLDFQKTENKTPKLNCKEYVLNDIVSELYDKFINYSELKKIDLTLSIPGDEKRAKIDKSIIDKIAFNMIDNAFRYAKSKIKISLEFHQNNFTISVADDGAGIADNEKEKVFHAFYQVDDKVDGGTGIGLAFSQLLANTHKADLRVVDSECGGALFSLSVPYIIEEEGKEIILEQNLTNEEPIDRKGNKTVYKSNTILLVEDNEELLSLLEESLNPHFQILKANNGAEALEILVNNDIDIVISDIMMPVMDGLELCKRIKTDLNYSHIPVVLLTAKVTTESKAEGMEHGADVYIEKPFSMLHVQKQIENLLKLRAAFQKQIISQPKLDMNTPSLSKKDQEFLEQLKLELDLHLSENDFYIDSIAENMYMSRSSFYRKIKGITGVAPNEFLKTLRLNKAAELLTEGSYTVTEVYEQVGFNSSSYFAKCFKDQFGILPKDYTK